MSSRPRHARSREPAATSEVAPGDTNVGSRPDQGARLRLAARGRDVGSIKTMADLVEVETVKTAMRFFHERAGGQRTGRMLNYGHLVVSIAKHWVKAPPSHIDALREITRACDPGMVGMTPKNRAMLRQFSTLEAKRRLVELPYRLLSGLAPARPLTKREAYRVECALLVQLLLRAPMRLANLVNLQLDRHISTLGGPRRPVVITLPREEVKNDVELTYPLSDARRGISSTCLLRRRARFLPAGRRPTCSPVGETAAKPA